MPVHHMCLVPIWVTRGIRFPRTGGTAGWEVKTDLVEDERTAGALSHRATLPAPQN